MTFKDGKVLIGRRKGSHGAGEWAFTGGHLEHGESLEQCARRETREECSIEIDNIRLLCVNNIKTYMPKHYLDVGFVADWKSGEPQIMEPDKRLEWEWRSVDDIPEPMFGVIRNYIEAYKTGRVLFDS